MTEFEKAVCRYSAKCSVCDFSTNDEPGAMQCRFCGIPFEDEEIMYCVDEDGKENYGVHYCEDCYKKKAEQKASRNPGSLKIPIPDCMVALSNVKLPIVSFSGKKKKKVNQ